MSASEAEGSAPWTRDYQEPGSAMFGYGLLSGVIFVIACAVSIVSAALLLISLLAFVAPDQGSTGARLGILAVSLLFLFPCYQLFRMSALPYRRSQAARAQQLAGSDRDVYFVEIGAWRWLGGPGSVTFRENTVDLAGTIHTDPSGASLAGLSVVPVAFLLHEVGLRPLLTIILALPVGLVAAYIVNRATGKRKEESVTIEVTPTTVRSIQCTGPLVTIRFKTPLAAKIRVVRFFVACHVRERFFASFEQVLPGLLPEAYRKALISGNLPNP